jgi:squalene synthase HpnC
MVRDLANAYAACARIARGHSENFPVASLLLPRRMRPHVAAVYAFARTADDLADEGDRTAGERLAMLDRWHDRLVKSVACGAGMTPGDATGSLFLALGSTIRECRLPVPLFEDLLSAFRQDVETTRYETWDDVLEYCRRSANPVGRLVLAIAGVEEAGIAESSDALCTALQLTNFWQDLAIDWRKGRLYLPLDECRRAGARFDDLDAGRISPAWRAVLGGAGERTAALFDRGRAVCGQVGGRLGFELRLTWSGGRRILSRLEQGGFDPFKRRPAIGAADAPGLLWQAMTWRAR